MNVLSPPETATEPVLAPPLKDADLEDVILPVLRCTSHTGGARLQPSNFGRSNYIGTADLFSSAMRLTDVRDGESNTLAVGETITDQGWALPGMGACTAPPNRGARFGSSHAGGAYFVLCDGAVRFISSAIAPEVFRALGTPAGGDVVGEY